MPRLRSPESDESIAAFFAKARTTAAADAKRTKRYMQQSVVDDVAGFLNDRTETMAGEQRTIPGFGTLARGRKALEARVTKETSESTTAEEVLETVLRDYIVVLARRTFREKHNVAVLEAHGLTHDGTVPEIHSREDRRALARRLIDGDAAEIPLGAPAMANPSAAELQAKLDAAVKEEGDITPVNRDLEALLE